MIKRDNLTHFIEETMGRELLDKAHAKDEVANGVQILGKTNVFKVALGVSVNEEFLKKAVDWGANYCIFHHGLDPRTYKSVLPNYTQKRMKLVFVNNLTIVGLHYSLDAHPEIGNNAIIIEKLGARIKDTLYEEWGYTATFQKAEDLHKLKAKAKKLFNHEIFSIEGGTKKITTIGVVSGSGKPSAQHFAEMQEKEVELFITGETSEWLPHEFKENGINFFACGHYATEVFGVKALGDKIEKEFGNKVEVKFLDVVNSI